MDSKVFAYGKAAVIVAVALIVMSAGWSNYEHSNIRRPLEEIREKEEKFKEISAEASYGGFMQTGTLVFNLKKIDRPDELTPLYFFFEYARALNRQKFDRVLIQYRGNTKYLLDGVNFTRVGTQIQVHEPAQVALEFPPLLKNLDGNQVFEEPFGDPQWVSQKQVNNLRDVILQWYAQDWVAEQGGKQTEKTSDSKGRVTGDPDTPEPSTTHDDFIIPDPDDEGTPEPEPSYDFDIPEIEPEEI